MAALVTKEDLEVGAVYPRMANIRAVSANVAASVAQKAYDMGWAAHTLLAMSPNAMSRVDPSFPELPGIL